MRLGDSSGQTLSFRKMLEKFLRKFEYYEHLVLLSALLGTYDVNSQLKTNR